MFSGIVGGRGRVIKAERAKASLRLGVALPPEHSQQIIKGASIAIDGVCLTVAAHHVQPDQTHSSVFFDVINETLSLTTLDAVTVGSHVNIERSIKLGDEIGGHLLSGHIMTMAELIQIDHSLSDNVLLYFKVPSLYFKYLFHKGYIAINGASLTLAKVLIEQQSICVSLIPETLALTTFGHIQVGDRVNIEIDAQTQAIVDTVERYMQRDSCEFQPKSG